MPKNHVPCTIRNLLKKRVLTAAWLAETARVDPGDLSRLINGRRVPRVTTARRLAKALGCSIESLWPETLPKRHK